MSEQSASRTLLKSPPELWAECSDAQSLTRHLDTFFGEIRITRLEPENTVAWEGERGSGTVRLEPAGWGTRVTLTASAGAEDGPAAAQVAPTGPALEQDDRAHAPARPTLRPATFLARLLRRFGTESHEPGSEVDALEGVPPVADPDRAPVEGPSESAGVLAAALESLGTAHHRPFSRS